MKILDRFVLYLKGICMGIADVIPGVSGGTLAMILGLYEDLIDTLSNLHMGWLGTICDYIRGREEDLTGELWSHYREMNLSFLLTLGAGILTAVVLGSLVIPTLLADHPVPVRGLFFGLILGSVWIPYTMLDETKTASMGVSLVCLIAGTAAGFLLTSPNLKINAAYEWEPVRSEGRTLGELLYRSPAARPAHRVFWHSRNQALREGLFKDRPALKSRLLGKRSSTVGAPSLKEQLKAKSEIYEAIELEADRNVYVPKLGTLYLFIAGFMAISAMILPGISGSYILLVFGTYFYVTFSLKSLLNGLFSGVLINESLLNVVIFLAGLIAGLLVLTRLLNYLLKRYRAPTLGVLTGLMIGCLRGVWPFRQVRGGRIVNRIPETLSGTVLSGVTTLVAGCLVVILLTVLTGNESPSEDAGEASS